MHVNILYQNFYPRDPAQVLSLQKKRADHFNAIQSGAIPPPCYIPLPDKIKAGSDFVDACIVFSREHLLDLVIFQSTAHISATFFFDLNTIWCNCSHLLAMADSLEFLTNMHGRDIGLTLIFRTHKEIP